LQDEWLVDCIFDGEVEEQVVSLFEAALRGETLPRKVEGHSPRLESIPPLRHRATFGAVEITRGCGRGCQFCSVALRAGKSLPLEQILANVRTQAAEGADFALLVTEDLFLYEHGARFAPNVPALKRLFESVAAVDGIDYLGLTHGTMAPIVAEPNMLSELQLAALSRFWRRVLYQLTDLQWEFFFTCWRYNLDFFHRAKSAHLVYNLGIPIYYFLLGRRLFGKAMKYPLLRLGHFPEWILKRKLYLDLTGKRPPKYRVPESVPIPEHSARPILPVM
jgi:hypothetical protein